MDIIRVKRLPIPKEKNGRAKMNMYGLPGMNKNHSIIYPTIEIACESIKAFFFPIILDIQATVGITAKVVTRAPRLPNSVGHTPAAAASPLNR